MFVQFTDTMQEETLLRCLLTCFQHLGGVPWVVTSDNMKTVTLGRDTHNQPVWHPAYQKFAVELGFHPDVCTPGAPNQKGAVENLVKFVKGNFLAGRAFYDDADLHHECRAWLHQVNAVRPSSATEPIPTALLAAEQAQFRPLPSTAMEYGFFDTVLVSRESLVAIDTNRYSVPAHLVGQALTARIYPARIEVYHGMDVVATHTRAVGRNARIVIPEHVEAVFVVKPRARVMVYRDWLVQLAPQVADYISLLCDKRMYEVDGQIGALYALARQTERTHFLHAVTQALTQQMIGAEYVSAFVTTTHPPTQRRTPAQVLPHLQMVPSQREVERDRAHDEQ